MNEDAPSSLLKDEPLWRAAIDEVNAWRGACLQQFSAAEAAVTETLVLLASIPGRGGEVKLRHLIGQRFEDLVKLVGEGGAFAAEDGAAGQALSEFRTMEGLRTSLAHGQAKVALDRAGRWIVVFRHVAIRARQPERSALFLEQDEALKKLAELKRRGRKLNAALGELRKAAGV